MGRLPSSPTMILLSEEKSSNALPPGSSLVTEQNAPSHTEDTVSSSGSIQQHAQSSAPPQGDYDPEEPDNLKTITQRQPGRRRSHCIKIPQLLYLYCSPSPT